MNAVAEVAAAAARAARETESAAAVAAAAETRVSCARRSCAKSATRGRGLE